MLMVARLAVPLAVLIGAVIALAVDPSPRTCLPGGMSPDGDPVQPDASSGTGAKKAATSASSRVRGMGGRLARNSRP